MPATTSNTTNPTAREKFKIAVVTAYYKPEPDIFRQCLESVQNQTYPGTHLLVADGHPQAALDHAPNTLHVVFPQANGDFGSTPRAIGCILADSYGFDGVAFLDDDNWLEPNHLDSMVALHRSTQAPLIAAQRIFRHLDGSVLPTTEAQEDNFTHVDTNCWLVMRPALALLGALRIPKFASFVNDRIFFQKAVRDRYAIAATRLRTVNYRTKYPVHYVNAGVALPEGAYEPTRLMANYIEFSKPERIAELAAAIGFYPKIS
jgi:glycosyltransferase involved in cell wall biosynthesis